MEFLLDGDGYSIPDVIPTNNSAPASTSPSVFGFHSGENSQLFDGFLQSHQKNPADSERISPGDAEGFMISRNGAQSDQRPLFPSSTVTDLKYAESTPGTITEPRRSSASMSVNGAGTAKVGKKRSKASSRAPTTLFNTDTANFRAMVQRFTGIPETPFRFSSMNPNFHAHVRQQEFLAKPLPNKAILDPNMNCVSHLNSPPDGYGPQQYKGTTFLPFQFLHDNVNMSSPLNFFPEAPQGQYSSKTTPQNDVGLINSSSAFATPSPTPSLTLPSDRRPRRQGQYSSKTTPQNDVGLINSASVFPTQSLTLPSDRSPGTAHRI